MSAGIIKVTPEQLHGVAGQLSSGAQNIESINTQLRGQVAPLGSDWAGVAQARFQQLWEEWQRSSRNLHEALTGISQLMNNAGTGYADNEAAIAQSFGR